MCKKKTTIKQINKDSTEKKMNIWFFENCVTLNFGSDLKHS